jgi:hypothetical protein
MMGLFQYLKVDEMAQVFFLGADNDGCGWRDWSITQFNKTGRRINVGDGIIQYLKVGEMAQVGR